MTSTATAVRGRQVDLILAELEQFPTLAAIAVQLLQLTDASESSTRQIIQLIEVFDSKPAETSFQRSEFWKHNLAVACACQLLAQSHDMGVEPEEAFVCGLLHDVGKIALDTCLPKSYDRVIRRTDATRSNISEVEHTLLGLDHTVAGRRLGLRWGLPTSIVESIWLHHQRPETLPASLTCPNHVKLVHLADLLVREQRIGYSGNYQFPERAGAVAERLGIPRDASEQVRRNLVDRIEERASLIGLDDLAGSAVYSSAPANEELGRLNVALGEQNRHLRIRSRYFDALVTLDRERSQEEGIKSVCRAAAMALHQGLDVSAALVFTPPTDGLYTYVGVAKTEAARAELLSLESLGRKASAPGLRPHPGANRCSFTPAGESVGAIAEQYRSWLGTGSRWVLPLHDHRQWVGSAILVTGDTEIAARRTEEKELEALLVGVGLALGGAQDRAESQRLAEELARANQELLAAQEQMLRHRSVHMLAEMASGAAHELNNPLAVVSGRCQMLLSTVSDDQVRSTLDLIHNQAHRCSEIVSELMSFAKPAPPKPQAVQLAGLLSRLQAKWVATYRLENDQITVNVADPEACIWADPDQIAEAFDAVVANAVAAFDSQSGKLSINCLPVLTDEIRTVEFADNGCGMAQDVLEHATDPFFSDRPAGRGLGMGLPRAYRLVEINQGTLELASSPGRGTQVLFHLPVPPADDG